MIRDKEYSIWRVLDFFIYAIMIIVDLNIMKTEDVFDNTLFYQSLLDPMEDEIVLSYFLYISAIILLYRLYYWVWGCIKTKGTLFQKALDVLKGFFKNYFLLFFF